MGSKTKIEWTRSDDGIEGATWNPIRGCTRISRGCEQCYAESIAARFSGPGMPYEGLAKMTPSGPRWTGKVDLVEKHLLDPVRWERPRRIFVNSMSDLFHEALPDKTIDRVFAVMAVASHHSFQVLTKRARRMREYLVDRASKAELIKIYAMDIASKMKVRAERFKFTWPLPNVWVGVSVENQATADQRIPELLGSPAAIRWVSYEPCLGPVDFRKYLPRRMSLDEIPGHALNDGCTEGRTRGLDQIIVGGESGPKARPMLPQWARSARDQCRDAGVAYFFKQHGRWAPEGPAGKEMLVDEEGRVVHPSRVPPLNWANKYTRMWDVGKKAAGCTLDGEILHQYPKT